MQDGATGLPWVRIASPAGELAVDPAIGNLRRLELSDGTRRLSPLATAPWVGQVAAELPKDLPAVERSLAGDFFCAPFGASDVEDAPPHGWSANSPWCIADCGYRRLEGTLDRPVMGARLRKVLQLAPDAPLLLQEHWIEGGSGSLTVAHHPMVSIAGQGKFTCSPKRVALTPEAPLEPGRNRLACPAEAQELTRFPGTGGDAVDLTALPIGEAHEDFVTLVEADHSGLGWSAVLRETEDDIVFFLKDPKILPVTMLWHSNGGRDHAPWNGRHRGVLGVEDGCAAGASGHRAAQGPNPVAATGVPTHLTLGPGVHHRIAHVTGAIARPPGWSRVADIYLADDRLILTGDTGGTRHLPFPVGFFERGA